MGIEKVPELLSSIDIFINVSIIRLGVYRSWPGTAATNHPIKNNLWSGFSIPIVRSLYLAVISGTDVREMFFRTREA